MLSEKSQDQQFFDWGTLSMIDQLVALKPFSDFQSPPQLDSIGARKHRSSRKSQASKNISCGQSIDLKGGLQKFQIQTQRHIQQITYYYQMEKKVYSNMKRQDDQWENRSDNIFDRQVAQQHHNYQQALRSRNQQISHHLVGRKGTLQFVQKLFDLLKQTERQFYKVELTYRTNKLRPRGSKITQSIEKKYQGYLAKRLILAVMLYKYKELKDCPRYIRQRMSFFFGKPVTIASLRTTFRDRDQILWFKTGRYSD